MPPASGPVKDRGRGTRKDGHRTGRHSRARAPARGSGRTRRVSDVPAGTSARWGIQSVLAKTVMPVPERTGLRSSWRVSAGARSAGHGIVGGGLLAGDLGGERRQQDDVADPGRGQQTVRAGPSDRSGPGRPPRPARRPGPGWPRSTATGRRGRRPPTWRRPGRRRRSTPPWLSGAGQPEPQDAERPVGRLGLHPGHRLGEVVGREVPAPGQGRDERGERSRARRPGRPPP